MKTIKVSASAKGMRDLQNQLARYRDSLPIKAEKFVSRLADVGIMVGKANCGEYTNAIAFTKTIYSDSQGHTIAYVSAKDKFPIVREWFYHGDIKQEEVSGLYMAEFGSGWYAKPLLPPPSGNGGQGTFPGQTHAFDENGWKWTTPDGEEHISFGEEPTYPIYNAFIEMRAEIIEIARECFND